jgi:hypothetical protein
VRNRGSLLFLVLLVLGLALSSGCLMAEQVGQGKEELVFHFDSEFNRILLFGRSAALVVVGLWVFSGSRRKALPVAVGSGMLVAALVLFVLGYSRLSRYRVEVADEGLLLRIPPTGEKSIAWGSIEEMYIEGVGPVRAMGGDPFTALLDLPEWHFMRLTVAGGASHDVDLRLLSVEQRQNLWKAIARRARLVKIE